ncbi:MAG TPA: hypothetical protein VF455_04575 [Chryseobacterium sp.]
MIVELISKKASDRIISNAIVIKSRTERKKFIHAINESEKILNLIFNFFINESNIANNPKPAENQHE